MIFQKMCSAVAIMVVSGGLAGCVTTEGTVKRQLPDGTVVVQGPVHVAVLPDGSRSAAVGLTDESLTISNAYVSTYHCPRHAPCKPTGGGMVGSSGAAPIISSVVNAAGMIGFGALGSNGGGGSSSVSFNNTVSASSSLKSSISNKNSGGNNAGIGNSSVIGSGNSKNLNVNHNTAGANAQNFNAVGGGKHH